MRSYNIGKKVMYICPVCNKHGQVDAAGFGIAMALKKRKGFE